MAERNDILSPPRSASYRGAFVLLTGTLVVLALIALTVGLRSYGDTGTPVREITLSAQDIKFNGTNPPLELRVGEKVAITVVNREAGVVHDFTISGLNIRSTGYLLPGASQTLVFTPEKAGVFRYGCTLHPGLMDGQVIVHK